MPIEIQKGMLSGSNNELMKWSYSEVAYCLCFRLKVTLDMTGKVRLGKTIFVLFIVDVAIFFFAPKFFFIFFVTQKSAKKITSPQQS